MNFTAFQLLQKGFVHQDVSGFTAFVAAKDTRFFHCVYNTGCPGVPDTQPPLEQRNRCRAESVRLRRARRLDLLGRTVRQDNPPSSDNASQKRPQWVRISINSRPSPSSATVGSIAPE